MQMFDSLEGYLFYHLNNTGLSLEKGYPTIFSLRPLIIELCAILDLARNIIDPAVPAIQSLVMTMGKDKLGINDPLLPIVKYGSRNM